MGITVLGSLNVDLVTKVKKAPQAGETIAGQDFNIYPGGKGANQAISIKRLGGNVTILGAIGNDSYGNYYHNILVDEKMDEHYLKRVDDPTGMAFITVEENGQNRIVIIHGANYSYNIDDLLKSEKVIHESNILLTQLEMKMDVIEKFCLLGKKNKKIVILNPAPACKLSKKILQSISIITPNESELSLITNMNTNTDANKIKACEYLLSFGIQHVIVTLGSRGCLIVNKDGHQIISGAKVKAIDTTAAGDSFNGALALALDHGENILKACQFANKVGALTVTKKGAITSLPYANDL